MAGNMLTKYIWIVDTIKRYGGIGREELNRLWLRSSVTDGNPFARRTFYNYRSAIASMLGVEIEFNQSTNEYFIAQDNSTESSSQRQQWLLDSMSISGMISSATDVSERIVLEYVPSAREFLPVIVEAMRLNRSISFSYKSYRRANPQHGIILEPYFVKIFKQLWYVIGYNVSDGKIKTYSLDRMEQLLITDREFTLPQGFSGEEFFSDCYGITTSQAGPKRIVLKVEPTQAKYFRALPLHPSQQEVIHDDYSIFTYHMCNTYDLRERILSHGSAVIVLEPAELKAQILDQLTQALNNYSGNSKEKSSS